MQWGLESGGVPGTAKRFLQEMQRQRQPTARNKHNH
jgi:hypothetical protein